MSIFTFRDLEAWKRGMDLVVECYEITKRFPRFEMFGLTSEIRRAAVSIPSNIAEGHCRRTRPAYANHVSVSLGSQGELSTDLEIAHRLKYVSDDEARRVLENTEFVGRLLYGLHRSLVS